MSLNTETLLCDVAGRQIRGITENFRRLISLSHCLYSFGILLQGNLSPGKGGLITWHIYWEAVFRGVEEAVNVFQKEALCQGIFE